jgi:hypothetical protein
MQQQKNLAISAIAMASAIHWDNLKPITDFDGPMEIFEELSKFSILSSQLLSDIHSEVAFEYKGNYICEVDEDFAKYFASEIINKSYSFDGCRLMLGQFAHEFFEMTPEILQSVEQIIFKHTGYGIAQTNKHQTFDEVSKIVSNLKLDELSQFSFPYIDFRTDWIKLEPYLADHEASFAEALLTICIEKNTAPKVNFSMGINLPKGGWTETLPSLIVQEQLKKYVDAILLKFEHAGIKIDSVTDDRQAVALHAARKHRDVVSKAA